MVGAVEEPAAPERAPACAACGRLLDAGPRFRFALDGRRTVVKCARCAPRHPPLLRKALATSLIVGTILSIINQGDALLGATRRRTCSGRSR